MDCAKFDFLEIGREGKSRPDNKHTKKKSKKYPDLESVFGVLSDRIPVPDIKKAE